MKTILFIIGCLLPEAWKTDVLTLTDEQLAQLTAFDEALLSAK